MSNTFLHSNMFTHNTNMPSDVSSIFTLLTILKAIQNIFGAEYDASEKYLIAIQGPTCSGKTTFSKAIMKCLKGNNIRCKHIGLDNYYKSTGTQVKNYNFDNPAALDWGQIKKVLRAIENNDKVITNQRYSFKTWESELYEEVNIYPQFVILEGIYAFNSINDYVFDINKMDPFKKQSENIYELVSNDYKPTFKILKLYLPMCKEASLACRTVRDIEERFYTSIQIKQQFEIYTWPSNLRWNANSEENADISISHGTHNLKECKLFLYSLIYFVNCMSNKENFKDKFIYRNPKVYNRCGCLELNNI